MAYVVGTVCTALSAVRMRHLDAGSPNPLTDGVWRLMTGAYKNLLRPQKHKAVLEFETFNRLAERVCDTMVDLRDMCAILLGFVACLQRAALARLDVCHLLWVAVICMLACLL